MPLKRKTTGERPDQEKQSRCDRYRIQLDALRKDAEEMHKEVESFFGTSANYNADSSGLSGLKVLRLQITKKLQALKEEPALDKDGVNLLARLSREKGWEVISAFKDDVAIMQDEKGRFFLQRDGCEFFPGRRFSYADPFSEGIAIVADKLGGGLYYIDKKGTAICGDKRFKRAFSFRNEIGIAGVDQRLSFIGRNGKNAFGEGESFPWISVEGAFDEGAVALSSGFNWKYLDKTGNILYLVEAGFESVGNYSGGLACISGKDQVYFINKKWEKVLGPFIAARSFKEGFATVADKLPDSYYIIDREGKELLGTGVRLLEAVSFANGYCAVKDEKGWFFVNKEGKDIFEGRRFNKVNNFSEGVASVQDDRGWFFVDAAGHDLFKKKFVYAESFNNGVAEVEDEKGDVYFINSRGKRVFGNRNWESLKVR